MAEKESEADCKRQPQDTAGRGIVRPLILPPRSGSPSGGSRRGEKPSRGGGGAETLQGGGKEEAGHVGDEIRDRIGAKEEAKLKRRRKRREEMP